jgi:hypothetical protein
MNNSYMRESFEGDTSNVLGSFHEIPLSGDSINSPSPLRGDRKNSNSRDRSYSNTRDTSSKRRDRT